MRDQNREIYNILNNTALATIKDYEQQIKDPSLTLDERSELLKFGSETKFMIALMNSIKSLANSGFSLITDDPFTGNNFLHFLAMNTTNPWIVDNAEAVIAKLYPDQNPTKNQKNLEGKTPIDCLGFYKNKPSNESIDLENLQEYEKLQNFYRLIVNSQNDGEDVATSVATAISVSKINIDEHYHDLLALATTNENENLKEFLSRYQEKKDNPKLALARFIKDLISDKGLDENAKKQFRESVLAEAQRLKLPTEIIDSSEQSLLHLVVMVGVIEDRALDYISESLQINPTIKDQAGKTAFQLAKTKRDEVAPTNKKRTYENLKPIINIETSDEEGSEVSENFTEQLNAAIRAIVDNNFEKLTAILEECGSKIVNMQQSGMTLMHTIIAMADEKVLEEKVTELLCYGPDLTIEDSDELTYLNYLENRDINSEMKGKIKRLIQPRLVESNNTSEPPNKKPRALSHSALSLQKSEEKSQTGRNSGS